MTSAGRKPPRQKKKLPERLRTEQVTVELLIYIASV
jgi:hypothetical protein